MEMTLSSPCGGTGGQRWIGVLILVAIAAIAGIFPLALIQQTEWSHHIDSDATLLQERPPSLTESRSHLTNASDTQILYNADKMDRIKNVAASMSNNRSKSQVVIYSRARTDRSGAVIQDMLRAHAYAFQRNLSYGGACSLASLPLLEQHHALLRLLGLQDLIQFACPSVTSQDIPILVERWRYGGASDELFTPDWLHHVHSRIQATEAQKDATDLYNQTLTVPTDRPPLQVAVHIRRGDVNPCKIYKSYRTNRDIYRYLPNIYYQRVLERYLLSPNSTSGGGGSEVARPVVITLYSENRSHEPWKDWTRWYTSRAASSPPPFFNLSFHLDGSLEEIWDRFLTADVLIMSKSSFSFVPAMLNWAGRVIYYPFWHTPLPHWTVVDEDIQEESDRTMDEFYRQKC